MIVPMKRLSLVLVARERDSVLKGLRDLGAVHLDLKASTTAEQEILLGRYRQVQDALNFLGKAPQKMPLTELPADALEQLQRLQQELKTVRETIVHWTRRAEAWASWGDFDPAEVQSLAAKGLYLNLYQISASQEEAFRSVEGRIVLFKDKNLVRFAVLSRSPGLLEGATHVPWPEIAPSRKKLMVREAEVLLAQLEAKAEQWKAWVPGFEAERKALEAQISWEAARGGVETEGGLAYLTGFVPASRKDELLTFARDQGVGVTLADPDSEIQPPTLLKNSFFPNLLKPVFELLGITPGYNERDISWPFFLFFSIFFGMILGDAAYGLILTAIGLVFLGKSFLSGGKGKEIWTLFTWLGLCTTAWGTVTGTWFAMDWRLLPPFLQGLVPPLFNPDVAGAAVSNNVTAFCFTLGAVQLGLASLWNLLQLVGSNPLKALSHLGWFGLTLGLYLLVLSMVANTSLLPAFFPEPLLSWFFVKTAAGLALPGWVVPLIGAGYLLVLLFSFQEGRFWKGLAEGVGNVLPTSLNAISAFADNISYIRLFAVGLAGYYIEVSFASMAGGIGMATPFTAAASVAVLVFGHTLNLVMGFLSVIVHGIRLNVLEFSNRLGMEWSGRPYDPFRVKS